MSLACITLLAESVWRNCHSFRKSQHKAIRYHLLPQRHSSPCDAEGREHREWEKDYHGVTANRIVSAGESDKTQHFDLWSYSSLQDKTDASIVLCLLRSSFRPPFVNFYTQIARVSQTFFVPLQPL
jgi:hypothetical protein